MKGSYINCKLKTHAYKMSAIIMFVNKMLGRKHEGNSPLGSQWTLTEK
jgi:hypothetical protein